ncbi:hypothetical protein EON64_15160, partial [archaeon]
MLESERSSSSMNPKKCRWKKWRLNFVILEDNIMFEIFSYLDIFADLLSLSVCSLSLRDCVLRNRIWGESPIDICVSRSCFECGRNKLSLANAKTVCSETAVEFIRLHVPLQSIPLFLGALAQRNSVKRMHLRIAAQRAQRGTLLDARSLQGLGEVLCLRSLTVYSWPRGGAQGDGTTEQFLCCVGSELLDLKFMEGAPPDLFPALSAACPRLQSVVVEGPQSAGGVSQLRSDMLQSLALIDTGLRTLDAPLRCPSLRRFELTSSPLD